MPETEKDIQRMQLDAERRIREMQRRSNNALHGYEKPPVPNYNNSNPPRHNQQSGSRTPNDESRLSKNGNRPTNGNRPQAQAQPQSQPQDRSPAPPAEPPQHGGFLSKFKGLDILKIFNFKNLHIDNDVLIIIALIFLLSTDETDELLIMALIYIML